MGVGVAGLQAIATAKRLGAVIEASDVRPPVKEQVESLGAKFIDVPYETDEEREIAKGVGGYARPMPEAWMKRQAAAAQESAEEIRTKAQEQADTLVADAQAAATKTREEADLINGARSSSLMRLLPSKLMTLTIGFSTTVMTSVDPCGSISTLAKRPEFTMR